MTNKLSKYDSLASKHCHCIRWTMSCSHFLNKNHSHLRSDNYNKLAMLIRLVNGEKIANRLPLYRELLIYWNNWLFVMIWNKNYSITHFYYHWLTPISMSLYAMPPGIKRRYDTVRTVNSPDSDSIPYHNGPINKRKTWNEDKERLNHITGWGFNPSWLQWFILKY